MQVIAHRGANKEALENSWRAFELAIDAGATRIEFDVQLTGDGDAIVLHDDELGRVAGVQKRVSQLTRKELEKLRLCDKSAIPFLDEVLEKLLPRVELNVEIKGAKAELAARVASLLKDHPQRDRVIVSSFHAEPLEWISQHAPTLKRACLLGSDTFSWPFFANMAPPVFLERCQTNIVHPHVSLVDRNFMDQAEARGWIVYAWVEMAGEEQGREGLWAAMKTFGLHGLCTNYPRQLHSWLAEAAKDEQRFRAHR